MATASLGAVCAIQGDSIDVEFGLLDRRDLTDYTCQLQIRDSGDVITAIDRALTTYNDDNTSFIGRVTPAETLTLVVGEYSISGQLVNVTEGLAIELPGTLTIIKQVNF